MPRSRQVFVNRNLRMEQIDLVGFDLDYTLASYRRHSVEALSFDLTLERLIERRGYPAALAELRYDPAFAMRGLALDRRTGNLLKMDRYGHVGRARHGRRPLSHAEKQRLYRDEKVQLKSSRFAWIDTLFALPEACLYALVVEALEQRGSRVDFNRLYIDIREGIDEVHADGSLKGIICRHLDRFLAPDPELGSALHRLRSAGKKLFLLTNSDLAYTDRILSHHLNGNLSEYPGWRHYFDIVICSAGKPAFFAQGSPFREIDPANGRVLGEARALERGRVYQGGNLRDFERLAPTSGERVLYVGDHIYGDILRSKKSSNWRTCMVIEELEEEIAYTDRNLERIQRLSDLEALRERLDDAVTSRKLSLAALERKLEAPGLSLAAREKLEALRRAERAELERARRWLRETTFDVDALEEAVETGANRFWGLLFKEGTETSRFGEQVEKYACLYTSRVSNLSRYSPLQYFRSPREVMPHERAGLSRSSRG